MRRANAIGVDRVASCAFLFVNLGASRGIANNGLNLLFSNDLGPLRAVRDIGLGLVDRMPPLKNALIRQAAGLTGEVPRLLRGEAL